MKKRLLILCAAREDPDILIVMEQTETGRGSVYVSPERNEGKSSSRKEAALLTVYPYLQREKSFSEVVLNLPKWKFEGVFNSRLGINCAHKFDVGLARPNSLGGK